MYKEMTITTTTITEVTEIIINIEPLIMIEVTLTYVVFGKSVILN